MVDVVALAGTAYETVKKLAAIRDKIKDADARNLIADLSISLADLKMEVASLKAENLDLQTKLKQKTEREARTLVVRDGVLWFETPPPGKPAGPYCPNCKENGGKLVLMEDKRKTPFAQMMKFVSYRFRRPVFARLQK